MNNNVKKILLSNIKLTECGGFHTYVGVVDDNYLSLSNDNQLLIDQILCFIYKSTNFRNYIKYIIDLLVLRETYNPAEPPEEEESLILNKLDFYWYKSSVEENDMIEKALKLIKGKE